MIAACHAGPYQLEEEAGLVCLERGLGVQGCGWALGVIDGGQDGCRREFLDELQGDVISRQARTRIVASGFDMFGHRDQRVWSLGG